MTLGEEYPKQQARLRGILIAASEIGPEGKFLVYLIEDCLHRSNIALINEDLPTMIMIYQEMKEFKE